jgi:hypothetical protein
MNTLFFRLKFVLIFVATAHISTAQIQQKPVVKIFNDTRIVNGQSTESNLQGQLKFIISHRFGRINGGAYELFGLDQATMRMGLDYGITDRLTIGIGRSTTEKTYDGFVKLKLLQQTKNGLPFALSYVSTAAIKTLRIPDINNEPFLLTSRLAYTHQLLLSSKITDRIALQIMPTLLHRNYTETRTEKNDVLAVGIAPSFKLTKMLKLSAEYYYTLPGYLPDSRKNSLAVGFEVETVGHVFQFHFGNSRGMTEKFFVGETTGSWLKGDIQFGFNISRDWQLKGRKW